MPLSFARETSTHCIGDRRSALESKLQVPLVTVSLGTIIFLLARFMWSQCRGVACSLRASFARVSQQFRFRVQLRLLCASRDPFFGGLLNSTSLCLQQVTSTSAPRITCPGSEALESTKLDSSFRLPVGVRPCYFRRYQVLAQLGLPPEKQDCIFLQRRRDVSPVWLNFNIHKELYAE